MDASELRALQAPLKKTYREAPAEARVVARAEGRLGDDVTCAVEGPSGETLAGLHSATGGDGSRACSADMLLEALVACAGVTLNSVATVLGVDVEGAVVRAEGVWDARGTLGVSREAPVGLTEIELSFELPADVEEETLEKLIELTERYCVIYQTLRNPPRITLRVAGGSPGG